MGPWHPSENTLFFCTNATRKKKYFFWLNLEPPLIDKSTTLNYGGGDGVKNPTLATFASGCLRRGLRRGRDLEEKRLHIEQRQSPHCCSFVFTVIVGCGTERWDKRRVYQTKITKWHSSSELFYFGSSFFLLGGVGWCPLRLQKKKKKRKL